MAGDSIGSMNQRLGLFSFSSSEVHRKIEEEEEDEEEAKVQ